jgi:thiamine-monophosphate kinase
MMPSEKQRISDFGEKKLIKRLLKRSQNIPFKSTFFDELSFKSLSDDAALIDFGENYLVATSDLLIKSAHFPDEMSAEQIGNKIVTVNVSDLAAMGAETLGIIISLAMPPDLTISEFDQLVEGILQACQKYNMALIGGDTNQSDELTLSGTCLGIVEKDKVLMKSGAVEGDVVAVTGPLGLAAAGLEVLFGDETNLKDINPNTKAKVIKHALQPEAPLDKGLLLAKTGAITSATDISDGLLSEIGEIIDSSESRVGITLYEEFLPIPPEVCEISKIRGKNALDMALTYGEDFELLLTVSKYRFDEIKDQIDIIKIGVVTTSGQIHMINKEGEIKILTPKGYEHFQKQI